LDFDFIERPLLSKEEEKELSEFIKKRKAKYKKSATKKAA
jgi:shikimate kinase